MNPISLNGGLYGSPYAGMRPEFQSRRPMDSGAGGISDNFAGAPMPSSEVQGKAPVGFDNLLTDMVQGVNAKQQAASEAVSGVLSGQGVPLHQAMVAMEEASVSFQLMVEVRNKLLEGYQELMRLQV